MTSFPPVRTPVMNESVSFSGSFAPFKYLFHPTCVHLHKTPVLKMPNNIWLCIRCPFSLSFGSPRGTVRKKLLVKMGLWGPLIYFSTSFRQSWVCPPKIWCVMTPSASFVYQNKNFFTFSLNNACCYFTISTVNCLNCCVGLYRPLMTCFSVLCLRIVFIKNNVAISPWSFSGALDAVMVEVHKHNAQPPGFAFICQFHRNKMAC